MKVDSMRFRNGIFVIKLQPIQGIYYEINYELLNYIFFSLLKYITYLHIIVHNCVELIHLHVRHL